VQPGPAGVDSDPRGDVEQGVADASWLGDAQFVVIDQLLQGDEQNGGEYHELDPRAVGGVIGERQAGQAGVFPGS